MDTERKRGIAEAEQPPLLMDEGQKPGQILIRSELNIERWSPLFVTSKYQGKSREFFRTLDDGRTVGVIVGRQLDHRGKVIEVGVLTVPGLKVFYSLINIWEKAGRPVDRLTHSTLPELARQMGRGWGGKDYSDLRRLLRNLNTIPISWIGSFYHKDQGALVSIEKGFHLLDNLEFYEKIKGNKLVVAAFGYKFNRLILQNLLAQYSKPLNLEAVLSLRKELSVLLYCHIDLILADKNRYERRTKELFKDLGVEGAKYEYPSARKQNLEPVLKELVGVRLSTGRLAQAYLQRTRDGKDYKAIFVKELFQPALLPKPEQEIRSLVSSMLEVLQDSKSEGFYYKVAMLCPSELIYKCLSEVKDEWLQGRVMRSKGALFTDKIKRYCRERGIDLGLRHAERSSGSNP